MEAQVFGDSQDMVIPDQRIVGARVRDMPPIESVDIALDRGINVFFGLNGAGKSRLIHALSLDPSVPADATVEIHLHSPPGPLEGIEVGSWLAKMPRNPWNLVLRPEVASEDFPGVSDTGPVGHLLRPAFEAARGVLDRLAKPQPRHVEAVVFRLIEETATTPHLVPELLSSTVITSFVEAALEIALGGRFILRLESGVLTLHLAVEPPDPRSTLGRMIDEVRQDLLASFAAQNEQQLADDLVLQFKHENEWVDTAPDSPSLLAYAKRMMLEREWEIRSLESCFHPLLRAGIGQVLERAKAETPPDWFANPVLEIAAWSDRDEPPGLTVMREWRAQDLDELQRTTFAHLPPLLERIGGSTAPEHDFGIISTGDGRAVFETSFMNEHVVETIEGMANSIYSALMDDAPRLEMVQRSPAGETRFFMWGLLDWTALEAGENRIHVSSLSDARRRWAQISIALALALRGGVREHPRMLIIDEPERGLHRTAERRLASGLAQLSEELNLTVLVASHSPAFIRLPNSRGHHVRRDARGQVSLHPLDPSTHDLGLLGISHSDSAQFLRALVLTSDELDAAAVKGFLGDAMRQHGIIVRALSDVNVHDLLDLEGATDDASQTELAFLNQVIRLTDARILVIADSSQFGLSGADEESTESEDWWNLPGPLTDGRDLELDDDCRDSPLSDLWSRHDSLLDVLRVMGQADRLEFRAFSRRDLLDALNFSPAFDFVGPQATEILARAWDRYYSTDDENSATIGIGSQVGEMIPAEAFREAAERSERAPEIISSILAFANPGHQFNDPIIDPYTTMPPFEDVPF